MSSKLKRKERSFNRSNKNHQKKKKKEEKDDIFQSEKLFENNDQFFTFLKENNHNPILPNQIQTFENQVPNDQIQYLSSKDQIQTLENQVLNNQVQISENQVPKDPISTLLDNGNNIQTFETSEDQNWFFENQTPFEDESIFFQNQLPLTPENQNQTPQVQNQRFLENDQRFEDNVLEDHFLSVLNNSSYIEHNERQPIEKTSNNPNNEYQFEFQISQNLSSFKPSKILPKSIHINENNSQLDQYFSKKEKKEFKEGFSFIEKHKNEFNSKITNLENLENQERIEDLKKNEEKFIKKIETTFQVVSPIDIIYTSIQKATSVNALKEIMQNLGLNLFFPDSSIIADIKKELIKDLQKELNPVYDKDKGYAYCSIGSILKLLIDKNASLQMMTNNDIIVMLSEDDQEIPVGGKGIKLKILNFNNLGTQVIENNYVLGLVNKNVSYQEMIDLIKKEVELINNSQFIYRTIPYNIFALYGGDYKSFIDNIIEININNFCFGCNSSMSDRKCWSPFKYLEDKKLVLSIGIKQLYLVLCILHLKLRVVESILKNIYNLNYFDNERFKNYLTEQNIKWVNFQEISNFETLDREKLNHFCIKGGAISNILKTLENEIDIEHQRKIDKKEFQNDTDKNNHSLTRDNLKNLLFSFKNMISFLTLPNEILKKLKDTELNRKDISIILGRDFENLYKKVFQVGGSYPFYIHFISCLIPTLIDLIGNLEIISMESFENSHQWIKRLYKNLVQKGSNNEMDCPLFQLFHFSLLPLFIEARRSLEMIKMNDNMYYYPPKLEDFCIDEKSRIDKISNILFSSNEKYEDRFLDLYQNFNKRAPGDKTIKKRNEMNQKKNLLYEKTIQSLSNLNIEKIDVNIHQFKEDIKSLKIYKPHKIFHNRPFVQRVFIETKAQRNVQYQRYSDINDKFIKLVQDNNDYDPVKDLILMKEKIGIKPKQNVEQYKSRNIEFKKIPNDSTFKFQAPITIQEDNQLNNEEKDDTSLSNTQVKFQNIHYNVLIKFYRLKEDEKIYHSLYDCIKHKFEICIQSKYHLNINRGIQNLSDREKEKSYIQTSFNNAFKGDFTLSFKNNMNLTIDATVDHKSFNGKLYSHLFKANIIIFNKNNLYHEFYEFENAYFSAYLATSNNTFYLLHVP